MVEKVASYHILRGDLTALAHFSEESARVLGKRGADTFLHTCGQARYFLLATDYHSQNIVQWHKIVKDTDNKMAQEEEDKNIFLSISPRLDVMATVFEFDSVLVCVRTLFDRLIQVLQTPFSMQLPISTTDFIKRTSGEMNHPLSQQLKKAWEDWGAKSAAYRDCMIHYSTLPTGLEGFFTKTQSRKLLIPDNPEGRSRTRFSYKKQIQLVDYALEMYQRCNQLTTSLFEQIFELLITEEFGDSAEFTYWDELPKINIERISGTHKLLISPGLVCDNAGKKIRIPRYVKLDNGHTSRDDIILSKEFLSTLQYPMIFEDNPVDSIEFSGAIQRMLE